MTTTTTTMLNARKPALLSVLWVFWLASLATPSTVTTMAMDIPDEAALAARQVQERLLAATLQQDLSGMQAALDDGALVNAPHGETGQTVLMTAVLYGKTDAVKYLIHTAHADPHIPEKDGFLPSHGAAYQGRVNIVQVLHEAGVDVTHVHVHDGYYPLHRACWGREPRHAETVRYYLQELHVDPRLPALNEKAQTCWDMTPNAQTKAVLQELGGMPKGQDL